MYNIDNSGVLTGRLTDEIREFPNRDGSRSLRFTIAAQDAFRSRNGVKGSQFIPVEAFIPARRGIGIYAHIHKGDKVSIAYSLRTNNYTDKSGVAHYGITVYIEDIKLQETKAVTAARHAALATAAS